MAGSATLSLESATLLDSGRMSVDTGIFLGSADPIVEDDSGEPHGDPHEDPHERSRGKDPSVVTWLSLRLDTDDASLALDELDFEPRQTEQNIAELASEFLKDSAREFVGNDGECAQEDAHGLNAAGVPFLSEAEVLSSFFPESEAMSSFFSEEADAISPLLTQTVPYVSMAQLLANEPLYVYGEAIDARKLSDGNIQMDQMDQMDQRNQIDQMDQMNQMNQIDQIGDKNVDQEEVEQPVFGAFQPCCSHESAGVQNYPVVPSGTELAIESMANQLELKINLPCPGHMYDYADCALDFKAFPAPACVKKRAKGSKNTAPPELEIEYQSELIPTLVIPCPELVNTARNDITGQQMEENRNKTVKIYSDELQTICKINRNCYIRLSLTSLHPYPNIAYETNANFHISRPYEPQFVRFEVDQSNGLPYNPTRCGLCPFCEKITFLNLKTSSYAQHLALTHGVYTDNFLTPNPYDFGEYRLVKSGSDRTTTAHENNRLGVVCPCCNQVIGTHCSQTTAKDRPLNNFLRHFRDHHRKRGKSVQKGGEYEFFNRMVRPSNYLYG